jgi:ubiquinone/menaquinone biosynthesis C-methylase UbiE
LNANNLPLITTAVGSLDLRAGATAADVGFGGGVGLRLLLDVVGDAGLVHGVDRSEAALAGAHRRYASEIAAGRLTIHESSMTSLPLDDASVDGAVTVNTIYFVDDMGLAATFAEFSRVLRAGGRLAAGIGDPTAMTDPLYQHGFHVRPVADVEAAAQLAGLRLVDHLRSRPQDDAPHVLVFARA